MSKVLIVEDELSIAELEKDYLELSSFEVEIETDGKQGLEKALKNDFDMIILDIMLPGVDGFEICKQIREAKEIPILMVSARKEDIDKIRGLGLGADDYITKPFSLKLVLMRIEAVLRRIKEKSEKQKILSAQGIELNKDSHEVYKNGAPVNLTQLEFELLLTFLNHKNQVLTRDNLIQQVWGYDFAGDEKTVNIHIMNLRRKLDTGCIHTIRGVGYKFESKN